MLGKLPKMRTRGKSPVSGTNPAIAVSQHRVLDVSAIILTERVKTGKNQGSLKYRWQWQ
jgi:hypothetical protein